MKNNIINLSGNDLSELNCLIGRLQTENEKTFLHVSDHVPTSLKNEIKKFSSKIDKEFERREAYLLDEYKIV